MKVSLISVTPEARELLLFTKQTRLSMDAGLMEEIRAWPEEKKQAELNYMLGTIKSSWDFINYVFSIEGVSRAFTHQLVRSDGAYAQQSQRTVDMGDFDYVIPAAWHAQDKPKQWVTKEQAVLLYEYDTTMNDIREGYTRLIQLGANPQDARGVLPTNVCTNIIAGYTLRDLHFMARVRLCTRTQGEYQDIFRLMRNEVLRIHPWADPFIRVACAADGVCQFPNYTECPIKPGIFNPDTGRRWDDAEDEDQICNFHPQLPLTKDEIQALWEVTRFEAVPKEMKK